MEHTQEHRALRLLSILSAIMALYAVIAGFDLFSPVDPKIKSVLYIVWASRIGAILLAIAIGLEIIRHRFSLKALWLSVIALTPINLLFWSFIIACWFPDCSPVQDDLDLQPAFLLYLMAMGAAIVGLQLSRPQ